MKYENKNKGFTLSELIAVLVVLTLLISIGSAVFINVRSSVLEKDYNNLVDYLTLKAEEYANETGITTISVQDLINAGLIKPDDNEFVYDPRNKATMNCYIIRSEFQNGHYVATLDEDYLNEDGTCKKYEPTVDYQICQVKEDGCYSIENGEWLTGEVTLGVHKGNGNEANLSEENGLTFNWSSNIGINDEDKNNSTIKIDSSGTKTIVYTCSIKVKEEGISQQISQTVLVDNDAPIIYGVEFDDTEKTVTKDVKIQAEDKGSGIAGYAIIDSEAKCPSNKSDYVSSNVITLNQKGTYKACVIDNVGNVGVTNEGFKVENIIEKASITVKGEDVYLEEPATVTVADYFGITCPDGMDCSNVKYYYNGSEITGTSLSLVAGVHKVTCKVVTNNIEELTTEAMTTIKVYPKIKVNNSPVSETAGRNKDVKNYFTITCSSEDCSTTCYYNSETNILNVNELGLGSYKITCKTYIKSDDSLKASDDVEVNIDFDIKGKSDSASVDVGTSKNVNEYFNIACNGDKCSTTCNYDNTSSLGVGTYTLTCTTKWNGDVQDSNKVTEKSASVNLTVYPKISAKNLSVTINVGDNYNVVNYFNVTCPTSGCNTTCNYSTTGSLAIGSYTLTCTTGIGNVKKSASVNLTVKARIPSTPSVSATLGSTSGSYYGGDWTNSSVYFSLSPSVSSDSITYYNVYWGSTKKTTINTSNNYATYSYTSNAETTVYFEACNENGCSSKTSGYSMNIDKTSPSCSLSVSSKYVTLSNYSSDVVDYGLTVGSSTSYNGLGAYKIAVARFYGHVRDRAGNTGTCSVRIAVKESEEYTYNCGTYNCNPYQCNPYECGSTSQTCTFRCYRKATSTEIANSTCYSVGAGKTGAYESTYKTCYVNATASTKDCSSVYSGKFPYLDNSYNNKCTSTGSSQTCYNTCYETCYETCTDYYEYCPSGYSQVSSSSVYCYR